MAGGDLAGPGQDPWHPRPVNAASGLPAEGRRVRYELVDPRLAEGLRILAALDLPGTCR
ncbi:MAG TPA: hypothetical protein VGS06_22985 [Streptosporangiaceae bacterium]|nr:hypothetical protein [Streptosporangiaceae bacterium]